MVFWRQLHKSGTNDRITAVPLRQIASSSVGLFYF
jgi:hypothetical protein